MKTGDRVELRDDRDEVDDDGDDVVARSCYLSAGGLSLERRWPCFLTQNRRPRSWLELVASRATARAASPA